MEELKEFEFDGTALAVIGHPISHSVSPVIHNAALRKMALDNQAFESWKYFRFDIHPDDLAEALKLFHEKKFKGLNLTIPHKIHALDMLDDIDPVAEKMGAVNTLLWQDAGYKGYNTDGIGFENAIKESLRTELKDNTIILLGAGGAARATAVQCLHSGCKELWIGNRTKARLDELLHFLKNEANGIPVHGFELGASLEQLPKEGVVVNATALGLAKRDPSPISFAKLSDQLKAFDMIYNPAETMFMKEARACQIVTANGLSMLVFQGLKSLEIWTGAEVPEMPMMLAAVDASYQG